MQCIEIPFGKRVKITVPEESDGLRITGVALSAEKEIPEKGRVVLYATPIDLEGKERSAVAIAPLTVGKTESVQVDLFLDIGNQIIFSTKGDNIDVTVTGFIENYEDVKKEIIE